MSHVAIDVRNNWLGGGIGQYVHHIAAGLGGTYDLLGLAHREDAEGFDFPVVKSRLTQRFVESRILSRLLPVSYNRLVGLMDVDCFVFPNNTMPAFRVEAPTVAVIHDMLPIRIKDFMRREGHGDRWFRAYENKYRTVAERADVICTVSEYTRNDVARTFGVSPDRFAIVPPGADLGVYSSRDEALDAEVGKRLGLPDRYVLYVGSNRAYKNVQGLIRGYAALPQALRSDVALVFSHGAGELKPLAESLGVGDRVRFLGGIEEKDKPSVYRLASVFGFLSYFEGFGMPALEAMAAGVPVLASNRASVPEVVGAAGLVVDPDDLSAVAQGLERILSDRPLRVRMAEEGQRRAALFTWEESVRKMSAAIEKAMKGGAR